MVQSKNSSSIAQINDLQIVELYTEPISGELAESIQNSISVNKIYLSRISELEVDSKLVLKSTPLFSYSDNVELVDNESEVEESSEKILLEIDTSFREGNANIIQSGKEYIAAVDGLFINIDNHLQVIPVSLHGSSDIRISDDSMSAFVDIYPSIDDNPITSLDDIVSKLLQMGVVAEINSPFLEKKLNEVEQNKNTFKDVCVAEGIPAQNGKNGRLENCTNKKEKLKNFDFGEFHKVNPVISVKENDTIAIIHPPTEGEAGSDIFGNRVSPIPGKKFDIRLGPNTKYSEGDETHIIAKTDGFVDLFETSISITDTFTVNGDIDFKSGNIVSKGSLKVKGNVKNEFTLSLTKDIEIGGYVGDAHVESGQKITIHGGFLGKGKGIVKAEGDVEVKFVENQKVFSRGSIYLVKETLNSQLYAKEVIKSKGQHSSIIGGHAIAGEMIEVYSLGNSTESETIIEVGFDYTKRNSMIDNKGKQGQLRKALEEVDKQIFEFAKMKRLNTQSTAKLKILAQQHKNIEAEIENIKEQNLKISGEIYIPTSSKISVNGIIHPGVKIGINGRFMTISHPLRAKTFILSEDNEVIAV